MLDGSDVQSALSPRFELLDQLGRGTMATVYHGRSRDQHREVAIKVVDLQDARFDPRERAEQQRRFQQEAQAQRQLSHPNVVHVYDHGYTDRHLYLVMEYVGGGTLADRLREGPMKPMEAVVVARQVAHGLHAAHELGFVHRDLKPANILLETSGSATIAKLTDFGLVKDLADQVSATKTGQMLGTPMYMAPEQIRGEPIDGRCDIYAFGVMLYRMLAGRPPFEEKQTAAVLMAHLNQPPLPIERPLPDTLVATIQRCLAKDRDERFADTAELQEALDRCHRVLVEPELDTTLRHTIPLTDPNKATPERSRTPLVAAALALLALAGLVGGAAWYSSSAQPKPTVVTEQAPAPVAPPDAAHDPLEDAPLLGPAEPSPQARATTSDTDTRARKHPATRHPQAASGGSSTTARPAPDSKNTTPKPVRPAATTGSAASPEPPPAEPEPTEAEPEPDLRVRQTDLKNPFAR